ncbi:hypothetical protein ND748_06585 [Frankia sp. AiPs1]|uniref:hypothetical protein n=1 Tax=Frankia sp. AiPs1 TaxID=573493 RepID=UPI002043FD77|nr:hypothetical protein [Frankia sp. AiPs1]MCM3921338.1 hypothetical protein [Frankia sp. AiPs1]
MARPHENDLPSEAVGFAYCTVTPEVAVAGTDGLLSWSAPGADVVDIAGLGRFPATGSVPVTLTASGRYFLRAAGPAGAARSRTNLVRVIAPPVITLVEVPAPPRADIGESLLRDPRTHGARRLPARHALGRMAVLPLSAASAPPPGVGPMAARNAFRTSGDARPGPATGEGAGWWRSTGELVGHIGGWTKPPPSGWSRRAAQVPRRRRSAGSRLRSRRGVRSP